MTHRHRAQLRRAAGLPLVVLALAGTAAAQDSAAPAPSTSRPIDFRLPPADEGRQAGVQGPSDNGLPPLAPGERRGAPTPTPAPAPQIVPPRVVPTQPSPSAVTPAAAPTRRDRSAAAASPSRAAPGPAASISAPPPVADGPAQASRDIETAPVEAVPPPSAANMAEPANGASDPPLWAWLLAGLAALGAGVWYWRRREGPTSAAFAGEAETLGLDAPQRAPRAASPAPPPAPAAPRPATQAAPRPATQAAPRPATQAVPAVPTPSPLVTRAAGEQRARVSMALQLQAIRFTGDDVAVSFMLDLANQGSLAAMGLMVRIALGQGSAMSEAVLARFFDGAGGSVLRDDIMLAPGASERVSSDVIMPRRAIEPLMIGGKPMLVPVLAFDVTYHWDGTGEAFGQAARSFVLGRAPASGTGDKLAPLPLDRPSYAVDRPGVRTTAIGRDQ